MGIKQISASQDIPNHYLSKILQTLVKAKILDSTKGPGGGFGLGIPAKKLTLYHIVAAIEGLEIFERCGIGLKDCSDKNPCPIHHLYKDARAKVKELLQHQTLEEISIEVEAGRSTYVAYKRGKSSR